MNSYQRLIVVVMVVTGTLNTVSAGLQLARQAKGKDGKMRYFEHYYVQTMFMMLGESLCMGAFLLLKHVIYRSDPAKVEGGALPMNPLVLWPPAFMDIVATALGYMGLGFMKDAGTFQMLRVSPIIYTGLLSICILRQRLKWFNWTGILLVCTGLIIKAIPDVLDQVHPNEDKSVGYGCLEKMHNFTFTAIDKGDEENNSEGGSSTDKVIGILLVLVGEFGHGLQAVYEEKFITKYNLAPLKVVGLEGINGFLTLAVLLWPVYFIVMPSSLAGTGLGPEGRFEDMLDALVQIFDGNNGGWLLAWTLGNMCSIAVFNFAGITVIKELSATTRAVLDQLRIVFIWAIFLIPFGPFLCIMQDYFHWTAPIGLFVVICGVWLYTDVIIMPLARKFLLKTPAQDSEAGQT